MNDIFTTDELKEIKSQIGDIGFPAGGSLESQIFTELIKSQALIRASKNMAEAIEKISKVTTNAIDMYQPLVNVLVEQSKKFTEAQDED